MSFEQCQIITQAMIGFKKPWFFAGGWALDLFLGVQTRHHDDIEIAIFRKDQFEMKSYLAGWELKKVVSGKFETWDNEYLELPIHEIHACRNFDSQKLEILLNESTQNNWLFRRNKSIIYPLNKVYRFSEEGFPFLKPEVVLLYKAKILGKRIIMIS